jgi:uncharacterized protein (DUF58 family)
MRLLKDIYLGTRLFIALGLVIMLLMLAFAFPVFMAVAQSVGVLLTVVFAYDLFSLFNRTVKVEVERIVPHVLSLGDDNVIRLHLRNKSGMHLYINLIDELPEQFQFRNFAINITIEPGAEKKLEYSLRPLSRGLYEFGFVQLYCRSALGLVQRRIHTGKEIQVPVYPSVIQLKKYELKTFARIASENGVKKVRRIGHSYEFEHIKTYNRGDDYRSINWKATGRKAQLMVNQYEDERSQQVYCIIDKSRVMHMPFHGLSLFDYAVNSALVMGNIILGKQDKAGLISFADTTKSIVRADRGRNQLRKIMDALYKEKEDLVEANYENLYLTCRNVINGRSLLMLYTNFESHYALQRVLPQLQKLNRQHLLVVIFFENTEIAKDTAKEVNSLEDIYTQVTAEQYTFTKLQLVQQLRQLGIIALLTRPEELTVSAINQYLELKARGMI